MKRDLVALLGRAGTIVASPAQLSRLSRGRLQRVLVGSLALAATLPAAEFVSREEAAATLRRAATYFHTRVAAHGGYVYFYAEDLGRRWGEGEATKDQVFVQPPGTPAVGDAFLKAHAATGEQLYLDAARAAGGAMVYGQLKSGGWSQAIDFDPKYSLEKIQLRHIRHFICVISNCCLCANT